MTSKCVNSIRLALFLLVAVVDSGSCRKKQLLDANAADSPSRGSVPPALTTSSDFIDYEPGVVVETILDGNKLNVSIYSTSAVPWQDYVYAVDSTASQLLKIQLPIDQGGSKKGIFRRIAGSEGRQPGYKDGWGEDALLDHPKGVAVDGDGNVYFADVRNCVIRKVTLAGYVSTVAGQQNKTGHVDGEGRNAFFSSDFDLTYLPRICSLLVSDRGNRRLRMIRLQPPENCNQEKPDSGFIWIFFSELFGGVVIILSAALATLWFQKRELQRSVAAYLALEGDGGSPFSENLNGQPSNVLDPSQTAFARSLLTNPPLAQQRGKSHPDDITNICTPSRCDLIDLEYLSSQERESSGQQSSLETSGADGSGDADDNGIIRRLRFGQDDDGSATVEAVRIRSLEFDLPSDSESSRTDPGDSLSCNLLGRSALGRIDAERAKALQQFIESSDAEKAKALQLVAESSGT